MQLFPWRNGSAEEGRHETGSQISCGIVMLTKIPPRLARLSLIAIFFVIWEVCVRKFGDPLFISPPSRVLVAIFRLARDKDVLAAIGLTCWELIFAFVLSVLIGLIVGLIIGLHRFTRGAMYPIVLLLYAIPLATILPLFVVVFGIGTASKIAFGVCHGVFPVIMTVVAGVQNVEPILLTSARSMGASPRQVLFSVIFPHMIPRFFTGLRLGMTAVLFGVLLAELYVSQAGVGHWTTEFAQTFQPQNLFALVAVLAAIAVLLNEMCRWAESRFTRWHG
jgi:ABC-type nitrate/sulfonate/bicarbonate transport system permease component